MKNLRINIDRIQNFLNTTHRWVKEGGKPVPTEEAIRRSKICAGCEFNLPTGARGRCPSCFARGAVLALFGYRSGSGVNTKFHEELLPMTDNPHNNELTYCGKCGCDLKLKVFIPKHVIANEGVDYPDHCWQREEDGATLEDEPKETTPNN